MYIFPAVYDAHRAYLEQDVLRAGGRQSRGSSGFGYRRGFDGHEPLDGVIGTKRFRSGGRVYVECLALVSGRLEPDVFVGGNCALSRRRQ